MLHDACSLLTNIPPNETTDRFFFDWDSLHARLNNYYKAWSYRKKKHKKVNLFRKNLQLKDVC